MDKKLQPHCNYYQQFDKHSISPTKIAKGLKKTICSTDLQEKSFRVFKATTPLHFN